MISSAVNPLIFCFFNLIYSITFRFFPSKETKQRGCLASSNLKKSGARQPLSQNITLPLAPPHLQMSYFHCKIEKWSFSIRS